jgi:phosphoribosylformylglycinamidine (FGAM) synthase PurS component
MNFHKEEHLDTELNIVPIIDCFVMLICFLLFTAAFTQLVFLEAKMTSNTAAAAQKSRSELDQFRLVITFEEQGLRLSTTGSAAKKVNVLVPMTGGGYDFKTLHGHLINLKAEHPERYSADIEFKMGKQQGSVDYEKITSAIDAVRHLSDEEYSVLRVAQKKVNKLELKDSEKEKVVPEEMDRLAKSLLGNQVSANADQKLLFPDVALVGLD